MNGDNQLLPSDRDWTEAKTLLSDLSDLNAAIARYVLRQLDVDAQQAEPMPVEAEQELGRQLAELGQRVQRRADRRLREATEHALMIEDQAQVGDGNRPQPQAFKPGPMPGQAGQASDLGTDP